LIRSEGIERKLNQISFKQTFKIKKNLKISFASSKKEQFELCSKEILGDYLTDGSSKQEELKL